jgi:ADP-heptose:LPS heptosyltransferase
VAFVTAGGAPGRPGSVLFVLRALGLGDLLAAVPAYRALGRAFPRHRLVLAAPAALEPLALLTGSVDEVWPVPGPGRAGHLEQLRWPGPTPDVAVNLHGRGPRSHRALLRLRPDRLLAYAHSSFPQVSGPAWDADEPERERWCRLLGHAGIAADPADLGLPQPPGHRSPAPAAVVLHPGAAVPSRRWPADRFAAVAAALREAGHWVVVTGTAAERGLATEVADRAGLGPGDVLAGRTSPLDLAALVSAARLVVCGDTGVAHLATAYGTPSVLLFGPAAPDRWGPPPSRTQHVVCWHPGPPGYPHGDRPDGALLKITPAEVIEAARRLLADRPAASAAAGGGGVPAAVVALPGARPRAAAG